MNRFATSDEHLGHQNILTGWDGKQTPRPFATMDDMVEGIIDRHNSVVRDGDEVYHLGDMFWRSFGELKAKWVLSRLYGRHFYVFGNHDEIIKESHLGLSGMFWDRAERMLLKDKLNKHGIVLDHYSGRVWNGSHKGAWQLYGHSHGNLNRAPESEYLLSMDVGVDTNNFTPVAFEDIAVKMHKRVERREKTFAQLTKQERSFNSITS